MKYTFLQMLQENSQSCIYYHINHSVLKHGLEEVLKMWLCRTWGNILMMAAGGSHSLHSSLGSAWLSRDLQLGSAEVLQCLGWVSGRPK